ncbi:hypothetical protein [Chryseobacterium sp.]|uniref:hypothetical protein n=1 Tax=Chryseobacterium sp. TaxID=1871047 RepID=UPI0038902C3C
MKKLLFGFLILTGFALQAQKINYDWKNMSFKQRQEALSTFSPEERKNLLMQFRNNMVLESLDIDGKNKTEFTAIYNEYLANQKKIKSEFNPHFNADALSEDEAKQKLIQSFDIGQKLLDNRKKYAEKMQQIIPSQKVLKLFNTEAMMRDKMNERKPHDGKNTTARKSP